MGDNGQPGVYPSWKEQTARRARRWCGGEVPGLGEPSHESQRSHETDTRACCKVHRTRSKSSGKQKKEHGGKVVQIAVQIAVHGAEGCFLGHGVFCTT